MATTDVLVVGSGAREHALAWKLARSPELGRLFAAPGSDGIAAVAECVPLRVDAHEAIVRFAVERRIGLAVIGPEAPLVAGLADRLREAGIPVFGPSAAAAQIEGSKAYARALMSRMGVPQPAYACFTSAPEALEHLGRLEAEGASGAVVKASGLAAGKGAIVCEAFAEAREAVRDMLQERRFGEAGAEIVIEELLRGEEASLFVVTDGERAVPFLPAQDYKRIFDRDRGPNTGGMGAYAPAPVISPELYEEALRTIVRPVLRGLAEDGCPYQGCLYAGVMRTAAGLRVIEFNCRFGDPETQAVLPLLESDLLPIFLAAARGELEGVETRWSRQRAVTVVLASGGYPGDYATGRPITGLDEAAACEGVTVFHAGIARRDGEWVTAGGRVASVTATGDSFAEAIAQAYAGVDRIRFEGRQFRSDIGARFREAGVWKQEECE